MLQPDQFEVNEAWIAFKLNDVPIHTATDGDFNFLALIDAASCFLLCFVPLPLDGGCPVSRPEPRSHPQL